MKERRGKGKKEEVRRKGVKICMCSDVGTRAGTVSLTVVAIALALCVFTQSVSAAHISVMPAFQTVSTGENFSVDIYVDPEGSEVFGAQYELHFNNSLLNATAQDKGPFFGSDSIVLKNEINNTMGWLKYGETRTATPGITEPGVLTTITFHAIADIDGLSELSFTVVKLSDSYANHIPANISNGSVEVRMGICGDVTDDSIVNMGDVALLLNNVSYPGNPTYALENEWAGDVTGDGVLNMGDVALLLNNVSYPGNPTYNLNCM